MPPCPPKARPCPPALDHPRCHATSGERRFARLDMRAASEVAERHHGGRHLPMQELLAAPGLHADGRQALLLCAPGKRSLAAALVLRRRSLIVRSVAGGLQNLE